MMTSIVQDLRATSCKDKERLNLLLLKKPLGTGDYSEASHLACTIFSTERTVDILEQWEVLSSSEREKILTRNYSVILDEYLDLFLSDAITNNLCVQKAA